MSETEPVASEFTCPHCGKIVAVSGDSVGQNVLCPHCSGEFAVPDDRTDDAAVPEDELSAIRIRQLAAGRRATYRARSYCVIAAAVCGVAAVQLIWMIVQQFRTAGWGLQCTGYSLFVVIAVYGLFFFVQRARGLHREAQRSQLAEPADAPDFSTLDDGSKRAKNLEDVR